MNATAPASLEDQLRATLRRRATVAPPRADAAAVHRRVQRRRRRRRALPALGVALALAGVLATGAWRDGGGTGGTATAAGTGLGEPDPALGYVELPGWDVVRYAEIRFPAEGATPAVVEPEYQWARAAQRMQLHVYPGGDAMFELRVRGEPRDAVEAFGLPASLLDYGTGRYRLDVQVGDEVYEFDGEPFASADDFLAAVAGARRSATAPPAAVSEPPFERGEPFALDPAAVNATVTADSAGAPDPAATTPGGK